MPASSRFPGGPGAPIPIRGADPWMSLGHVGTSRDDTRPVSITSKPVRPPAKSAGVVTTRSCRDVLGVTVGLPEKQIPELSTMDLGFAPVDELGRVFGEFVNRQDPVDGPAGRESDRFEHEQEPRFPGVRTRHVEQELAVVCAKLDQGSTQVEHEKREQVSVSIQPNPFNPKTQIRFSQSQAGKVSVRVYSLRGTLVWEKELSGLAAGHHTIEWHGTDSAGLAVASGVYLVQVRLPTAVLNKRAVLLK